LKRLKKNVGVYSHEFISVHRQTVQADDAMRILGIE